MCIRDDWLIDISPLAEASAGYKRMLDVEYFMRRTFPLRNLISQLVKYKAVALQAECLTNIIVSLSYKYKKGEGGFLHPLKRSGFRRQDL